MRALRLSEKITCWLAGGFLLLLLAAGGVYAYATWINPRCKDAFVYQLFVWRVEQKCAEFARANALGSKDNADSFGYTLSVLAPELWSMTLCGGDPRGSARNYDLSALRGLPVRKLEISFVSVSDLSALHGMHLRELSITFSPVTDIRPLRGMALKSLILKNTRIHDLSALVGMPLECLDVSDTSVEDLTPLVGMPLKTLVCDNTKVSDISPLQSASGLTLSYSGTPAEAKGKAAEEPGSKAHLESME